MSLFHRYLKSEGIFKNKEALSTNNYMPERLPHREKQIEHIASILAPSLKKEIPSNIMIYGKTGTGKTAAASFVAKDLEETANSMSVPLKSIYINCQHVDTKYRILTHIANQFIEAWEEMVPFTGLPMEEVQNRMGKRIEEFSGMVIIILDEIDVMVAKQGDDVLYTLTRFNDLLSKSRISIIGISNKLDFREFLDPRVKSGLSEEEINFPPYDAIQLFDILKDRASVAFNANVIEDMIIKRCAAIAAQEDGDARKAISLLKRAGEIADREGNKNINDSYIQKAQYSMESDRINDAIKTLPLHSKMVLLSIYHLEKLHNEHLTTGEVYEGYSEICKMTGNEILTSRRVTDFISELDMLGLIAATTKSYGRHGRTKNIRLSVPIDKVKTSLATDLLLGSVVDARLSVSKQERLDGF